MIDSLGLPDYAQTSADREVLAGRRISLLQQHRDETTELLARDRLHEIKDQLVNKRKQPTVTRRLVDADGCGSGTVGVAKFDRESLNLLTNLPHGVGWSGG